MWSIPVSNWSRVLSSAHIGHSDVPGCLLIKKLEQDFLLVVLSRHQRHDCNAASNGHWLWTSVAVNNHGKLWASSWSETVNCLTYQIRSVALPCLLHHRKTWKVEVYDRGTKNRNEWNLPSNSLPLTTMVLYLCLEFLDSGIVFITEFGGGRIIQNPCGDTT